MQRLTPAQRRILAAEQAKLMDKFRAAKTDAQREAIQRQMDRLNAAFS